MYKPDIHRPKQPPGTASESSSSSPSQSFHSSLSLASSGDLYTPSLPSGSQESDSSTPSPGVTEGAVVGCPELRREAILHARKPKSNRTRNNGSVRNAGGSLYTRGYTSSSSPDTVVIDRRSSNSNGRVHVHNLGSHTNNSNSNNQCDKSNETNSSDDNDNVSLNASHDSDTDDSSDSASTSDSEDASLDSVSSSTASWRKAALGPPTKHSHPPGHRHRHGHRHGRSHANGHAHLAMSSSASASMSTAAAATAAAATAAAGDAAAGDAAGPAAMMSYRDILKNTPTPAPSRPQSTSDLDVYGLGRVHRGVGRGGMVSPADLGLRVMRISGTSKQQYSSDNSQSSHNQYHTHQPHHHHHHHHDDTEGLGTQWEQVKLPMYTSKELSSAPVMSSPSSMEPASVFTDGFAVPRVFRLAAGAGPLSGRAVVSNANANTNANTNTNTNSSINSTDASATSAPSAPTSDFAVQTRYYRGAPFSSSASAAGSCTTDTAAAAAAVGVSVGGGSGGTPVALTPADGDRDVKASSTLLRTTSSSLPSALASSCSSANHASRSGAFDGDMPPVVGEKRSRHRAIGPTPSPHDEFGDSAEHKHHEDLHNMHALGLDCAAHASVTELLPSRALYSRRGSITGTRGYVHLGDTRGPKRARSNPRPPRGIKLLSELQPPLSHLRIHQGSARDGVVHIVGDAAVGQGVVTALSYAANADVLSAVTAGDKSVGTIMRTWDDVAGSGVGVGAGSGHSAHENHSHHAELHSYAPVITAPINFGLRACVNLPPAPAQPREHGLEHQMQMQMQMQTDAFVPSPLATMSMSMSTSTATSSSTMMPSVAFQPLQQQHQEGQEELHLQRQHDHHHHHPHHSHHQHQQQHPHMCYPLLRASSSAQSTSLSTASYPANTVYTNSPSFAAASDMHPSAVPIAEPFTLANAQHSMMKEVPLLPTYASFAKTEPASALPALDVTAADGTRTGANTGASASASAGAGDRGFMFPSSYSPPHQSQVSMAPAAHEDLSRVGAGAASAATSAAASAVLSVDMFMAPSSDAATPAGSATPVNGAALRAHHHTEAPSSSHHVFFPEGL